MSDDKMGVAGTLKVTLVRKDGSKEVVYDDPNAIRDGLRGGLRLAIHTATLDIALDNLFTTDNQQVGGTQNGFDGIICEDIAGVPFTTITTVEAPTNTFGKKWQGEITFTTAEDIAAAKLGQDFGGGGADFFTVVYALVGFTTVSVQPDDRMIFEWEIFF